MQPHRKVPESPSRILTGSETGENRSVFPHRFSIRRPVFELPWEALMHSVPS